MTRVVLSVSNSQEPAAFLTRWVVGLFPGFLYAKTFQVQVRQRMTFQTLSARWTKLSPCPVVP